MTLKEQLMADLKTAMRGKDTEKRDTIRLLQAAIKQEEIDSQTTLDDTAVQAVLTKQAKQRRESIADYTKAGRDELVAEEEKQLAIIELYLPQMMSQDEIEVVARDTIAELGVTDIKGMGQVMGQLMPKLKGQADGRDVNEVVRRLLQNQ